MLTSCDFRFLCPMKWDEMADLPDGSGKHCEHCQRPVVTWRSLYRDDPADPLRTDLKSGSITHGFIASRRLRQEHLLMPWSMGESEAACDLDGFAREGHAGLATRR